MLKHWAPLTNDDLKREFKPVQSHLKNALFYKTIVGAQVGDATMSLIETSVLNRENPFEYFVALQENARDVNERPDDWLPWNWRLLSRRNPAQSRSYKNQQHPLTENQ